MIKRCNILILIFLKKSGIIKARAIRYKENEYDSDFCISITILELTEWG